MNMTRILRMLSLVLCGVLIAALALTITGCNDKDPSVENQQGSQTAASTATTNEATPPATDGETSAESGVTVKGEGATVFTFTVTNAEGQDTIFEIHTDKTVVGEALQELGLIDGEEGAYGLYVKTVNGLTVNYDTDGAYWAFYVNGEYAMTGVDKTNIEPGATYTFKVEKG